MANSKVKLAIFGAVVVLALVAIIGLVVHRSLTRDRICENRDELYYEAPESEGICLKSNERGPCGNNMILIADKRNGSKGVGICGCNVNESERAMIHHKETNQCYYIFTQAYCAEGEWLTVKKDRGPGCDLRQCEKSEDHALSEFVPLSDGRCVLLGKFDNATCNRSQVIRFFKRKIYPACSTLGTTIGSIGVPTHDCPEGYFSTGAGHCQPDFDFD